MPITREFLNQVKRELPGRKELHAALERPVNVGVIADHFLKARRDAQSRADKEMVDHLSRTWRKLEGLEV